jgi:putative tryptophan/tyrosine transport system substrate-binding protein
MRRRDFFIAVVGGIAVGWPFTAPAQHAKIPVIGYINSRSPNESADIVAAFRQGLKESGFVEGANVKIESRFAAGDFARLPDLAADLLRDRVNVIVATGGTVSVVKIKPIVPRTVPIVFAMGGDPVKLGVVASLNRPGENITGVAFLVNGLASKQIQLLHELVPRQAEAVLFRTSHDCQHQWLVPQHDTPPLRAVLHPLNTSFIEGFSLTAD